MKIPTWKASGHRGSWFADVNGESFPCVHQYWTHTGSGKMIYDDPGCNQGDDSKWLVFLDSLREKKRAVLTRDQTLDGGKTFKREAYIGLYRIGDVAVAEGHLRFQFLERLANISN